MQDDLLMPSDTKLEDAINFWKVTSPPFNYAICITSRAIYKLMCPSYHDLRICFLTIRYLQLLFNDSLSSAAI